MIQIFGLNLGTIVSLLVVSFIVFLAVRSMVRDKKAGIGICGQKCANCKGCGGVHGKDNIGH